MNYTEPQGSKHNQKHKHVLVWNYFWSDPDLRAVSRPLLVKIGQCNLSLYFILPEGATYRDARKILKEIHFYPHIFQKSDLNKNHCPCAIVKPTWQSFPQMKKISIYPHSQEFYWDKGIKPRTSLLIHGNRSEIIMTVWYNSAWGEHFVHTLLYINCSMWSRSR